MYSKAQPFLNTSEISQQLNFCYQHNTQKDLISCVYSASDPLTVCSCLHLLCFCCACAHRYTLKREFCVMFVVTVACTSTSSMRFYPALRLTKKIKRTETKFSAVQKRMRVAGQWTQAYSYSAGEGRNLEFHSIFLAHPKGKGGKAITWLIDFNDCFVCVENMNRHKWKFQKKKKA